MSYDVMKILITLVIWFSIITITPAFSQEQSCDSDSHLYNVILESDGYFSPNLGTDQDLTITGDVLDKDCNGISKIKIIAELKRGETTFSKTVNSNDDGSFEIILETAGKVSHHNDFQLYLTAVYGEPFRLHVADVTFFDIQRFAVTEEDQTAVVEISQSYGSRVVSFDFDKDSKKISLELVHFDSEAAQFLVAIPANLLSGDITVLREGQPAFILTENNLYDNDYGPRMDPENNDIRHSHSLRGKIVEDYSTIDYNFIPYETHTIEIVGSKVIPEFHPVIIFVLSISMICMILANKIFPDVLSFKI